MRSGKRVTASLTGLFAVLLSASSFAEIAVIVHPSNNSAIDSTAINKIFMGKQKKFANGQIAIPMNAPKGSPLRDSFNKNVIGRSSSQVNAYWSKLVFTGQASMPKELSSDQEMVSTVAANQGAIGYVDAAAVTGDVKVVGKF